MYEAWRSLEEERNGRRVKLIAADLPVCEADPDLLKEVFVKLLSNALKYTRAREAAVIEVGWRKDGRWPAATVYFVKDNGVGFDMEDARDLFEVFERLHPDEAYEGAGIGLAIVKRIIRRHGGDVWAEAERDKGASFYFVL
jgi:signal transduction histidine kinase